MQKYSSTTQDMGFQQLLSMRFSETEAIKLLHMKEHVTEQREYRERIEESRRLTFLRWLIDHGRMSS